MLSSIFVLTLLGCFVAIYATETALLPREMSDLTSPDEKPDTTQCFPSSCTPSSFTSFDHVSGTRDMSTAASLSSDNENTEPGNVVQVMRMRRIENILASVGSRKDVHNWLSTLQEDGKWPESEVDYTRGCQAIRANWPAQGHWKRILMMAAAWNYALRHSSQPKHTRKLRDAISRAMDYWFNRDITNLACLDHGGTDQCPCTNTSDTTFWNRNWYSNVILIPGLVSQVCLLMKDDLTATHLAKCAEMTKRSFDFFYHAKRPGFLNGANIMDIGRIGIDAGLLDSNVTLLHDAFDEVHQEMRIHNKTKDDGVRADGTFGQHLGVLYNGNYGKDFINLVLDIEIIAVETEFTAAPESREAVERLLDADRWMIVQNVVTKVLHWDLSVVGRFISLPVYDNQATGGIKLSLDGIKDLGRKWSSLSMVNFAKSLSRYSSTANAGNLVGNRMFFANDYMVHRGPNYVSTLKMYSSRTLNSECVNSQNPFGFHLSDGTLYTYNQGDEYEDIAAVWDWNLIPGITIDYGATPLMCTNTSSTGIEAFVGGVSDGFTGLAAMRFTNPLTKSLSWQKTWFFIEDDVQHVMISKISSANDAQVFSVLDQRHHTGKVILDNEEVQTLDNAQAKSSLWHSNVGYTFDHLSSGNKVLTRVERRSGNWSNIGTSNQPPTSSVIFTALIEHQNHSASESYTAFPGTTPETFERKRNQLRLQTIQNNEHISAIFDEQHNAIYVTFWDPSGGTVTCYSSNFAPITITASGNIVLMYKLEAGKVTVADPSQHLHVVSVVVILGSGNKPPKWGVEQMKVFQFVLPSNGVAGSSVSQTIT